MHRKQNHQSVRRLLVYLVNEYNLQLQIEKQNSLNDKKMVRKLEEICKSAGLYKRCGKSCTVSSRYPQSPLTSRLKAVEGSNNKLMSFWKKSDFICVWLKLLPSGILINPDGISDSSCTHEYFSLCKKCKDGNVWSKSERCFLKCCDALWKEEDISKSVPRDCAWPVAAREHHATQLLPQSNMNGWIFSPISSICRDQDYCLSVILE